MNDLELEKFLKEIEKKKLWIFDLDGVIYRGDEVIKGAPEVIQSLRDQEVRTVFLTNNSTRTREMYVDTLKKHGINAKIEEIFTSACITVDRLEMVSRSIHKEKRNINTYVIGEKGLKRELEEAGFSLKTSDDFDDISTYKKVDIVVVGLDRQVTYHKLFIGLNCLLQGATFIVTNDDANMPMEGEFIAPGTGSIVQALITASGRIPEQGSPYGKPNPLVYEVIEDSTGIPKNEMIVVGDRLETDILSAKKANITNILVLSGITRKENHIPDEFSPDFILGSVDELNHLLMKY